jgi:hypothetical protein
MWNYTLSNPVNYTDPSGNVPCHMLPPEDQVNCVSSSVPPNYGISFSGSWPRQAKSAVYDAVRAVGARLSTLPALTGRSPSEAFRLVYRNGVNFLWDTSCYYCRPNSYSQNYYHPCIDKGDFGQTDPECKPVGGVTLGSDQIMFATLYSDRIKARNNVVHELGHVFNNLAGGLPVQAVEAAYSAAYAKKYGLDCYYRENWPKRTNPDYGPNYGFASRKDERIWQMHYSIGSDIYTEEFADMFLGWVFNKWEVNNQTHAGTTRSDWMNEYMPGWVDMIINGQ